MIIDIPLNGGLRTFADSEQIGNDGCTVLKNIDIHIPGKFQTRTIFGDKATCATDIKSISKWVAPNGTTYWVFFSEDDSKFYLSTDFTLTSDGSLDFTADWNTAKIANYGDYLRFFGNLTKRPQTLHYYPPTRKHFWSMDSSRFSEGFSMSEGIPDLDTSRFNLFVALEPNAKSTTSYPFGNLDLQNKVYYYKLAPVFDGVQEGLLSEILVDTSEISSTNDSTGVIQYILSFKDVDSKFDNRLSGLNFYRATESGGPYYKILSASCLGDTDPSLTKVTDGDIGLDVYVPDNTLSTNELSGKSILIDGVYIAIASNTKNILTLGTDLSTYELSVGRSTIRSFGDGICALTIGDILFADTNTSTGAEDATFWEKQTGSNDLTITHGADYSPRGSGFRIVSADTTLETRAWHSHNFTAGNTYYYHFLYKSDADFEVGQGFSPGGSNYQLDSDTKSTVPNSSNEWAVFTGSFTSKSLAFDSFMIQLEQSKTIYIDDFVISSSAITSIPQSYCGADTLVSPSLSLDRTDGKKGNMVYLYKDVGTYTSNRTFSAVKANTDKAIQFTSDVGIIDSAVEMHLGKNYLWRQASSTRYDIVFHDHALNDGISPALEAVSDISVNYKYSQFLDGRNYVANVKFPNTNNEEHSNWVIYSELNQPDVLPVSNYIEIQDSQGGEILGLGRMLGDLVIFMEKGIYRLHTPSTDPGSWSLIESEENIGCVAPDSIIEVEGVLYFAGKDHIYGLDANFQAVPITKNIQDVWQGTSSQENTKITYDPKLKRLLCQFGGSNQVIYVFHLGTGEWTTIEIYNGATIRADHIVFDENLVCNIIKDDSSSLIADNNINSNFDTLNVNNEISIATERQTGWIKIAEGTESSIIRKLNLRLSTPSIATPQVHLYIYADGDDSTAIWSKTLSGTAYSDKILSLRVSRRATNFKVKIVSDLSSLNGTQDYGSLTISRLGVEVD
jgi:hypothetical protein